MGSVTLRGCVPGSRCTCNTGMTRMVAKQLSGVKKGEVKAFFSLNFQSAALFVSVDILRHSAL